MANVWECSISEEITVLYKVQGSSYHYFVKQINMSTIMEYTVMVNYTQG